MEYKIVLVKVEQRTDAAEELNNIDNVTAKYLTI